MKNRWGDILDGSSYTHDLLSQRTNILRDLGWTSSSVVAGYDPIGQLTSWHAKESGGALRHNEQLGWKYDAAGNLNYRTNGALLQTFNSDNANQLSAITRVGPLTITGNTPAPATNVTVNGQTAERYGDFTFARTNHTLNNPNNTFTIIAQNTYGLSKTNTTSYHLPTPISLAYDSNGNLTNDGLRSFAYDAENQLTTNWIAGQWKTEFVYDGLGRRRITRDYGWSGGWVLTNEVRHVYDGLLPIQERDTNNNALVTYTRGLDLSGSIHGAGGIGGLLARTDANGSAFYHADGSGNITALINTAGDIVARYVYNPFGKLIGKWGTLADANVMRFSSKEEVRGLYHYGFRFYDPNLQCWITQDPLEEEGGINLYGFVDNDPVNWFDIDGLSKGSARSGPRGGPGRSLPPPVRGSGSNGRMTERDFQREMVRQRNLTNFERNVERAAIERALERRFQGHKPGQTYLTSGSPAAPCPPQGGVYGLRDPVSGEVMRTGRSNDLRRRSGEHQRDSRLSSFEFDPLFRTDVYREQRGLEQFAHEYFKPPLNFVSPIGATNPNRHNYVNSASQFLNNQR